MLRAFRQIGSGDRVTTNQKEDKIFFTRICVDTLSQLRAENILTRNVLLTTRKMLKKIHQDILTRYFLECIYTYTIHTHYIHTHYIQIHYIHIHHIHIHYIHISMHTHIYVHRYTNTCAHTCTGVFRVDRHFH